MDGHVLIVEDEQRLRDIIRDYFTAHGADCDLARDGAEALELLRENDYDAILLDVLMPNLDGFAVCRAVREHSGVPILFLTALGGEEDVLRGYALGADDYVTKPFSLAVLLAKTGALIRRSRGGPGTETLTCGVIALEPGRRACTVDGRAVELPPREYELLLCLMRHQGAGASCWTGCGASTSRGATGRWTAGSRPSGPPWGARESRSRRCSRRATSWRRERRERQASVSAGLCPDAVHLSGRLGGGHGGAGVAQLAVERGGHSHQRI